MSKKARDPHGTHHRPAAESTALSEEKCPECDGRGQVLDAPSRVLTGRTYWEKCEDCNGTGKKARDQQ